MNSVLKLALVMLAVAVLSGCEPTKPESPNMMDQVLGALQVSGQAERDVALATACRECAAHGDGDSVLMGIPRIEDTGLRDEVAQECITKLQSAGSKDVLRKVAELISDPVKRDELLKSLMTE